VLQNLTYEVFAILVNRKFLLFTTPADSSRVDRVQKSERPPARRTTRAVLSDFLGPANLHCPAHLYV